MLAKFKHLNKYINYGVWIFQNGFDKDPIKKQIGHVNVSYFNKDEWTITSVYIIGVGYISNLDEIFMSMREATKYAKEMLKKNEVKKVSDMKNNIYHIQHEIKKLEEQKDRLNKYIEQSKNKIYQYCLDLEKCKNE